MGYYGSSGYCTKCDGNLTTSDVGATSLNACVGKLVVVFCQFACITDPSSESFISGITRMATSLGNTAGATPPVPLKHGKVLWPFPGCRVHFNSVFLNNPHDSMWCVCVLWYHFAEPGCAALGLEVTNVTPNVTDQTFTGVLKNITMQLPTECDAQSGPKGAYFVVEASPFSRNITIDTCNEDPWHTVINVFKANGERLLTCCSRKHRGPAESTHATVPSRSTHS